MIALPFTNMTTAAELGTATTTSCSRTLQYVVTPSVDCIPRSDGVEAGHAGDDGAGVASGDIDMPGTRVDQPESHTQ